MWKQMLPGLRMTLVFTVLTGLIYPGLITGVCQAVFPTQANGSMVTKNGKAVGSMLIGQNFTKPEYFHGRPSAAGSDGYDASASSGSNLGPTSAKLMDRIKSGVKAYREENNSTANDLAADAVTASASGLDPHITPANAEAQSARVATARSIQVEKVKSLVAEFTEGRTLGVLGEPRINVLALNMALDERFPTSR